MLLCVPVGTKHSQTRLKVYLLFLLAGFYIYIETSSPRRNNDKAILTLTGANSKSVCFSFYYHMYGTNINRLNIYNRGKVIWTMAGNQGNSWKKAEVSITGDYDVSVDGKDNLVFSPYTCYFRGMGYFIGRI